MGILAALLLFACGESSREQDIEERGSPMPTSSADSAGAEMYAAALARALLARPRDFDLRTVTVGADSGSWILTLRSATLAAREVQIEVQRADWRVTRVIVPADLDARPEPFRTTVLWSPASAVEVSEIILKHIYGAAAIDQQKPLSARDSAGVWLVSGSRPSNSIGGEAHAEIRADDGRLIRHYHTR